MRSAALERMRNDATSGSSSGTKRRDDGVLNRMTKKTKMIELIASDLDGTLLRHDGTLSPRTKDAVRAAVAAGFKVVLASGRPPRTVLPIAEQLGLKGLAVCSNGAILYDLDRKEPFGHRH